MMMFECKMVLVGAKRKQERTSACVPILLAEEASTTFLDVGCSAVNMGNRRESTAA